MTGHPNLFVRELALAMPEAVEDFPWGERAIKVAGKVFVFLGRDTTDQAGFSVKLPTSGRSWIDRGLAQPTGYGLGRHGWVSITFGPDDGVGPEALRAVVEESFRAVAPKRLRTAAAPVLPLET